MTLDRLVDRRVVGLTLRRRRGRRRLEDGGRRRLGYQLRDRNRRGLGQVHVEIDRHRHRHARGADLRRGRSPVAGGRLGDLRRRRVGSLAAFAQGDRIVIVLGLAQEVIVVKAIAAGPVHVGAGAGDFHLVHLAHPLGVPDQQREVGHRADHPRHALAELVDRLGRRGREQLAARVAAGDPQAVTDHVVGVGLVQVAQEVAHRQPLPELGHRSDHPFERLLSGEDQREEKRLGQRQVEQDAQLLQDVRPMSQHLSLVQRDDAGDALAL